MYMIRYRLRTATEWRSIMLHDAVASFTEEDAHTFKERMERAHGLTHTYNVEAL
jgi:hypothetical protein